MKFHLEGVIPALLTPFTKIGKHVDYEKAGALAVRLADQGVHGVFPCGTTGEGMLLTLEVNEERAREARDNFARAGVSDRVSVVVGDAQLKIAKVSGPFDLIFQDGDKQLYTPLLGRLVALLRPGGLLITDNVLWGGEVVPGFAPTPRQNAADTRAIIEYNERVSAHPDLLTSIVPLRDGVSISVKRSG